MFRKNMTTVNSYQSPVFLLAALFSILCCFSCYADEMVVEKFNSTKEKKVLGWVERVKIIDSDLLIEAKLSPAITLSSLDANNIETYSKGGKRYVKFSIEGRDGKKAMLKFPVLGTKRTVTASGKKYKKYVVSLPICLAGEVFSAEVLLSDRDNLEHELRLGREMLAGHFIIDPANTHTTKPVCVDSSKRTGN